MPDIYFTFHMHDVNTQYFIDRRKGIDCNNSIRNMNRDQREGTHTHLEVKESCKTCLYTGVGTCAAVSLYSLKSALLDLPDSVEARNMSKEAVRALHSQKRFLIGFAGAWGIVGCYRWYLG